MKKVLVIGELCNDYFIYGDCPRICPEAPVPVFRPKRKTVNQGMAGNTRNNIQSLRQEWEISLLSNDNPITKTRFIDEESGQMIIRVDKNDAATPIKFKSIPSLIKGYDAVVFSDYCKGFIDAPTIEDISSACREKDILTFLDTKKPLGKWVKSVDYLKINSNEAKSYYEVSGKDIPPIANKATIITKGAAGCEVHLPKSPSYIVNGYPSEVVEVSGAGDSFLSGFVCRMLETNDLNEACSYANLVASIAVSHRGVVSVTENEVVAKGKSLTKTP